MSRRAEDAANSRSSDAWWSNKDSNGHADDDDDDDDDDDEERTDHFQEHGQEVDQNGHTASRTGTAAARGRGMLNDTATTSSADESAEQFPVHVVEDDDEGPFRTATAGPAVYAAPARIYDGSSDSENDVSASGAIISMNGIDAKHASDHDEDSAKANGISAAVDGGDEDDDDDVDGPSDGLARTAASDDRYVHVVVVIGAVP